MDGRIKRYADLAQRIRRNKGVRLAYRLTVPWEQRFLLRVNWAALRFKWLVIVWNIKLIRVGFLMMKLCWLALLLPFLCTFSLIRWLFRTHGARAA